MTVPTYRAWSAQREAEADLCDAQGWPWRAAAIRTHITPAVYRSLFGGAL